MSLCFFQGDESSYQKISDIKIHPEFHSSTSKNNLAAVMMEGSGVRITPNVGVACLQTDRIKNFIGMDMTDYTWKFSGSQPGGQSFTVT